MTKVISFFNTAGGVGKSTLTQNIGYHLHLFGKKVLLVDLDTNASLTAFCGIWETEQLITVYDSFSEMIPLEPIELEYYDLVPTDINLVGAEVYLIERAVKNNQNFRYYLQQILEPIKDNYDYILIDCPASFGLLAINALACSDWLLIPFATYFKAYNALEKLFQCYEIVHSTVNPNLNILGIVPSKFDSRTKQCHNTLQGLKETLAPSGLKIFEPIRLAIDFVNASEKSQPLGVYAKLHPQVGNLMMIAKAIIQQEIDS